MSPNVTSTLSAKQLQAAWFLGRGIGVGVVAKRLGVRRETVSRWKKISVFQKEVTRLGEEQRQILALQMAELLHHSVEVIEHTLLHSSSDKRLQIAMAIIEQIGIERFKVFMAER